MCTSFAANLGPTVYGMNFDFEPIDCRLRVTPEGDFFVDAFVMGQFLETLGMNRWGLFGNFQANFTKGQTPVVADHEGLSVSDLYLQALRTFDRVGPLVDLVGQKTITYAHLDGDLQQVHNLFADPSGGAAIVETYAGRNLVQQFRQPAVVMSNFGLRETETTEDETNKHLGLERYRIVREALEGRSGHLGPDQAMGVLSRAVQEGSCETLFSVVCLPHSQEALVCVRRNFDLVWKVDLRQGILGPASSRHPAPTFDLRQGPVLLRELG